MARQVIKVIKAQARGGQANPAPPLGPALGQAGVDINAFCTKFNEMTQDRKGQVIPVVIRVYEDRSFDFQLKAPPASALIMEKAGIQKGSGVPNKEKVGTITKAHLREIAGKKMSDLNTKDIEAAMRTIEGTAKNMGVTIE